jgi:hypothetical protein
MRALEMNSFGRCIGCVMLQLAPTFSSSLLNIGEACTGYSLQQVVELDPPVMTPLQVLSLLSHHRLQVLCMDVRVVLEVAKPH